MPAAACVLLAEVSLVVILAVSFALAWTFCLIPLTIACLTVAVMKGPARRPGACPRDQHSSRGECM